MLSPYYISSDTMRKTVSLLIASLVSLCLYAAVPSAAVVNVITYDAQGSVLHSGYGFYVSADGRAVVPYTLLQDAYRAEVIDAKGARSTVTRLAGASSALDIAIVYAPTRKADFLTIAPAEGAALAEGSTATLAYYTTNKKDTPLAATITRAEAYGAYAYYTLSTDNSDKYFGCPLLDATGQVVGIVQRSVGKDATSACAVDARFVHQCGVEAISALGSDYAALHFPVMLPEQEQDAYSFVYMLIRSGAADEKVKPALDDYVAAYPDSVKGYLERATYATEHLDFAAADADIKAALATGLHADEVHNTYANLILSKQTAMPEPAYGDWTLERALAEAERAYAIRPQGLYELQQASVLFVMQRYAEAAAHYAAVAQSSIGQPEHHYLAARALKLTGDESVMPEVMAHLDSAVAGYTAPYPVEAAKYLLERSQVRLMQRQYRLAVADLNDYEKAVGPQNLNAEFYAMRMGAERSAKMYQQAINDANTAAHFAGEAEGPYYRLEAALIYLQTRNFTEAADIALEVTRQKPDSADAYKVLGIAQGYLGKRSEALQHLAEAKRLGDDSVDTFIEKIKSGTLGQ